MRKSLILTSLSLFVTLIALSFVSAHDIYYDNHYHYNTVPVSRVYYSNYDDRYYVPEVRVTRVYYAPVFVGPYPRYYGHGYQDVYFRIDNYNRDHYRNHYMDDYYYNNRYDDYNRYDDNMHPFYNRY